MKRDTAVALTRAGQDDAGEIQWIGRGHIKRDIRSCFGTPDCAQQIDSFRTGELFAGKAADKTTSANLSLSFHAPEDGQQIAPRRGDGLSGEKVTEQHPPAEQQLRGVAPGTLLPRERCCGAGQQGPTAGSVTRPPVTSPPFPTAAFWIDECAQVFKAVSCYQPGGGQFPQRIFHFAWETPRSAHQVPKERRAVIGQRGQNLASSERTGSLSQPLVMPTRSASLDPPLRRTKWAQCVWAEPAGQHRSRRMRGKARPHDFSGKAQIIQIFGTTLRYAS